MRLPNVPAQYRAATEKERNRTLELADRQNRKRRDDVEIGDERLILKSPDGTRFNITVANDGTISATSL
ncbi:hypothetical protein PVV74_17335 [Roseovarius sp. SK2]|uniref:hypothetical protein n=1 Tax=Roseovarius TaxID=74030 RepID=UPI00237C4582|nr:hypothetical protein [Roseovarius sp. SK2]MDD9727227.1 hypothetical protein [Roseovarius sp. SK2]